MKLSQLKLVVYFKALNANKNLAPVIQYLRQQKNIDHEGNEDFVINALHYFLVYRLRIYNLLFFNWFQGELFFSEGIKSIFLSIP